MAGYLHGFICLFVCKVPQKQMKVYDVDTGINRPARFSYIWEQLRLVFKKQTNKAMQILCHLTQDIILIALHFVHYLLSAYSW